MGTSGRRLQWVNLRADYNRLHHAVTLPMTLSIDKKPTCACVPGGTYTSDIAEEHVVLLLSCPVSQTHASLQRLVGVVCSPERIAGGTDDCCVHCGAEYFVQHVRHWGDLAQTKVFTLFLCRYGAAGGHAKNRCRVFVNSTLCVNGTHFMLRALA